MTQYHLRKSYPPPRIFNFSFILRNNSLQHFSITYFFNSPTTEAEQNPHIPHIQSLIFHLISYTTCLHGISNAETEKIKQ